MSIDMNAAIGYIRSCGSTGAQPHLIAEFLKTEEDVTIVKRLLVQHSAVTWVEANKTFRVAPRAATPTVAPSASTSSPVPDPTPTPPH